MTTAEPSPWGPGPSSPGPSPYPGTYQGPWGTAPAAAAGWPGPTWPTQHHPVTDEQLRSLPPPVASAPWLRPIAVPEQRPAVVALAVTLAVTASLLWVCGLSLFVLLAVAGTHAMSPVGEEGFVFHLLDEVVLRLGDGLWLPLYGFPLTSIVSGFLLLLRRTWTQIAHSVVGAASLGWAAWWLRDSLLTWCVVAVYVATAVAVLWVPSARRWYSEGQRHPS